MKTSDLLDYCAKELLDDRTEMVEGDPDALWSDTYLLRQMNKAQQILCRRSWAIIETGIAPAGVIVLVTGKVLYDLHPSILRVFDATPSTQVAPLGRTDDIQLRDPSPLGGDAFDVGEVAAREATALTGATLAFATDAGTRQLRVYPTPTDTQNGIIVALKIARLPLVELSIDDTDAEPEIDEQWHMDLAEYAAGKALTLPLVDADQKVEGRRLLAEFAETVRQARQERVRAEMGTGRWAFNSTTATLGR
ncbi:MAG: hypothetical protein NUV51_11070 [Sulfuricaulis sp.]|nr:hypothetical protein [Sulfuricaulis sp.]